MALGSVTILSSTIKIYHNKIEGKHLDLSFLAFKHKKYSSLALEIIQREASTIAIVYNIIVEKMLNLFFFEFQAKIIFAFWHL